MPQATGPKQTAKENLVFAYDVGDVKNSYAGEPTTNYQVGWSPWTAGGINTDVTGTVDQGPIKNALTWKFEKTGGSNQWNGWEATYGGIWTGNSGDVWTTSYWYKTSAPAGVTGFGIGNFYTPDWARPYSVSILAQSNGIIADGQWHYNYTTTQFNENYSNAIIVDGPSWGYSPQTGTLYINGLQWEKKSHPTPFAAYVRSTTQALKPIVSNTTIDLFNVSFDANAQIIFDGTNDKINLGLLNITNTAFTYETVIKTDSITGGYSWILGKAGYNMGLNRYDNYLKFFLYDSSNNLYSAEGGTLNTTSYFHVVGVYTGLNLQLYVNGVLINTSGAISTPKNYDGTDTYIGTPNGSSLFYQGQIPVAKVYNRALTATEIQQNYKSYKTRFKLS